MADYPSAAEIMSLARKIPPLAQKKINEEGESRREMVEDHPAPDGWGLARLKPWFTYLDRLHDWIPDAFETLTEPDIGQLSTISEALRKTEGTFAHGGSGMVHTMMELLGDGGWDGALATNVKGNFLSPLRSPIMNNQALLAKTMAELLHAAEQLYATGRKNALKLAQDTLTALEACGDCSGSDIAMGMVIAGAMISVAGIPIVGIVASGTTVSMALEGIKGGLAVGDKLVTADKELPIGADTVTGVITNMSKALADIQGDVSKGEKSIAGMLTNNYNLVTQLRARAAGDGVSSPFMPLKPKINKTSDYHGLA